MQKIFLTFEFFSTDSYVELHTDAENLVLSAEKTIDLEFVV
jgi:hypothetical protein